MPIEEALATQSTPMAAANKAGIDQISYFQEIVFTRYQKLTLPADGYVFWVRSNLVSHSALVGSAVAGETSPNSSPAVISPETISVRGSLHYSTDTRQDEDETLSINRVVFTSEKLVEDLNVIAPDTLWLGEWQGVRFSFSARSSFYEQAGLHHYVGDAVYADMTPQIIDNSNQFSELTVVSNSLPIWLSMNAWMPVPYLPFSNPSLRLYPSFLVPDNIRPPFVSVHVEPGGTRALAAAPALGRRLSHYQLATDHVKLTLWGVRNNLAQDFADFVNQFSLSTDLIGVMNMPIMRDEKRTQSELGTISQKKTIEYDVSYYQTSARDVARQLIRRVIPTYVFTN